MSANTLTPSRPLKTTHSPDDTGRIICGIYTDEPDRRRLLQIVLHPSYVNLINPGNPSGRGAYRDPILFSLTNPEAHALYEILKQRYEASPKESPSS